MTIFRILLVPVLSVAVLLCDSLAFLPQTQTSIISTRSTIHQSESVRRRRPLFSRRPRRANSDDEYGNFQYEDERYYEDDEWESTSSSLPRRRVNGEGRRRRPRSPPPIDDDDVEEFMEDTEDEESDISTAGNFWVNAAAPSDPSSSSKQRSTPVSKNNTGRTRNNGQRSRPNPKPRRPSTFRSGTPPPPEPVSDLYDRLFWYGLDPNDEDDDDSSLVSDRTMFGGTRGKFNGLGFLGDVEATKNNNNNPRLLPSSSSASAGRKKKGRSQRNYYDDDEDEDGGYYGDDFLLEAGDNDDDYSYDYEDNYSENTSSGNTPPFDPPRRTNSRPARVSPRQTTRRRKPRRYEEEDEDDDFWEDRPIRQRRGGSRAQKNNGWVSDAVSSWFEDDEEDDDEDWEDSRPRSRRRKNGRDSNEDKPVFNLIDSFFGFNREKMDRQAEAYNQRMGLSKTTSPNGRRRRRPSSYDDYGDVDDYLFDDRRPRSDGYSDDLGTRRRSGYAYPYTDDEKDDEPPVAEIEVIPEYDDEEEQGEVGMEAKRSKNGAKEQSTTARSRELSWEERALAIERVPPADVQAWGPSGALPTDARTKAIEDALADILEAKRKVEMRQQRAEDAREQLSILRVDNNLEKKRILADRSAPSRKVQEYLIRMEKTVEDASRNYRLAQQLLQVANEEINDLERRHWAVLQFYNPDQAEELVEETLQEFSSEEATARRTGEKNETEMLDSDSDSPGSGDA